MPFPRDTDTPSTRRARSLRHAPVLALAAALALAACTSTPEPPATPKLTDATPAQMVAAIRASAGDGEGELAVQPLRDPEVEDLREQAQRMERQGHLADAAKALDAAIAIVADDPALLQERAEVALLQSDYAQAATLAERANAMGAQVGPLCRRHWATIEQVRLQQGDAAAAAAAKQKVAACKLAAPNRY